MAVAGGGGVGRQRCLGLVESRSASAVSGGGSPDAGFVVVEQAE